MNNDTNAHLQDDIWREVTTREASDDGHFYGAWRGGKASSGGGPASEKGRGTAAERRKEMADRVGKENVGQQTSLTRKLMARKGTPGGVGRMNPGSSPDSVIKPGPMSSTERHGIGGHPGASMRPGDVARARLAKEQRDRAKDNLRQGDFNADRIRANVQGRREKARLEDEVQTSPLPNSFFQPAPTVGDNMTTLKPLAPGGTPPRVKLLGTQVVRGTRSQDRVVVEQNGKKYYVKPSMLGSGSPAPKPAARPKDTIARQKQEFNAAVAGNKDTWVPGGGGTETPFLRGGTRYLRVYNPKTRKHGFLNLDTDMVEPDR